MRHAQGRWWFLGLSPPSVGRMEYGGVALVAAVIVVLAVMVPARIDKQTALTQSRELDRFSPDLRLIGADAAGPRPENCVRESADPETLPAVNVALNRAPNSVNASSAVVSSVGVEMSDEAQSEGSGRTRVREGHAGSGAGRKEIVRQISRLKARRAARLSAERAAGQRRMVMSLAAAALTVVFAAVAALTSFAWAWVLLPAGALIGELVWSRRAAVRSQRLGMVEMDELSALRDSLHRPLESARKPVDVARPATVQRPKPAVGAAKEPLTSASGANGTQRVDGLAAQQPQRTPAVAASVQSAPSDSVHPFGGDLSVDSAQLDSERSWTVAHIPAPTYATGQRIAHRMIHTDTDLRGIPRVSAHVPARPVSVSADGVTESTEEVAERSAASFNLEEVLDQRRA